MYLAPRQGRFAVVLLCSFCMLFCCFVWNAQHSAKRERHEMLTGALARLSDEVRLPLSLGDKVGLAVVAERYYDDNTVKYLRIHDAKGAVVLGLGALSHAPAIQMPVLDSEQLLGEVSLVPKEVNRGAIIRAYWPFLLMLLLGHIMLWLIYGYIARPTLKMQETLKKELEQTVQTALAQNKAEQSPPSAETVSENQEVSPTKTQQSADAVPFASFGFDAMPKSSTAQTLAVVFGFVDEYGRIEMLSEDSALQYLKLCDEILKKTLAKLLKTTDFVGIGVVQVDTFSANGATVLMAKTKSEANLVLASTTVAKLVLMVFAEVYERQRKFGLFALPMCAFLCEHKDSKAAQKALATQGFKLALGLDEPLLAQIGDWVSIKPTEPFGNRQPCHEVVGVSSALSKKLEDFKFAILTEENPPK